jgi:hypothetical protein
LEERPSKLVLASTYEIAVSGPAAAEAVPTATAVVLLGLLAGRLDWLATQAASARATGRAVSPSDASGRRGGPSATPEATLARAFGGRGTYARNNTHTFELVPRHMSCV